MGGGKAPSVEQPPPPPPEPIKTVRKIKPATKDSGGSKKKRGRRELKIRRDTEDSTNVSGAGSGANV